MLAYFAILVFFGLIMLTSASAPLAYNKFADKYFFVRRQLLFGFLPGLALFFFLVKFYYRRLAALAGVIFVVSLLAVALVFVPGIGTTLGTGARSWILFAGQSMQPAEFLKLGLIIFFAYYLSRKGGELLDWQKGFLSAVALAALPLGLVVLQPDIGTALVLFAIFFGMLFAAGANLWHLLALFGVGLAGFVFMILAAPYRAARLLTFLQPQLDQLGLGYHINQAYLAIGSGGIFGRGLWGSVRKYEFLPEVSADSIFAVIAEETGFIFSAAFLLLLVLICFRTLKIAKTAPDGFGRLLAVGITIWFIVQSFINIAAMVGLAPLTGLPLPFVSHGGTALAFAMAAVGILVNISKYTDMKRET